MTVRAACWSRVSSTQQNAPDREGLPAQREEQERAIREHGIDVAQLSGTGACGRVTRDDVLSFIDRGPQVAESQAAPAAPAEVAEVAALQRST